MFLKITPGSLAVFKEHFAPVAAHANSAAEPGCLSYELSVNPDDETDLLIFERYVTKADLEGPHRAHEAFKKVRCWGGATASRALPFLHALTRRPPPPAPPAPQFGKWLNEESGILVSKASKAFVETNVGHMIRG